MLTARVDTSGVDSQLRKLARAGQDIAPLLREAKKPLRTDIREHQRTTRGPDGPWSARASSTLRKRGRTKSGRRRRTRLLGRLPTSLSILVVGRDTLVARSKVPWAYVHQEGGRVGRGARIPARPFLYFGREFIDDVEQALGVYLARAWGKG